MNAVYIPQAGSVAERALAHMRTLPEGVEIGSGPLADALGIPSNIVNVSLNSAAKHGALVRSKRHDRIFWKLGPAADAALAPPPPAAPPPEPATPTDLHGDSDDDAAPIARTIPSDAVEPIPGLVQQSWCPVGQAADSLGSGGEPPAAAPCPAPPKPAGLGWRSPRVPVFDRDASADNTTPPAGPAEAGRPGLAIDDDTARALTAALAPTDTAPKGAEAAQAPAAPCGRDDATPNDGVVSQGPDEGFRCALWSNGMLEMRPTDGELVLLNADDTRGLLRYVGDMLSARARAAA